jgi:hypothetical protein
VRDRVADWPVDRPPPTEDEDLKAAQAHFGAGLTRAEFRIVREEETPPEWRKRGPRGPRSS